MSEIKKIHRDVKQTYGSPRMTAQLRHSGFSCSENTVAKLMRLNGIRAKMERQYKPRQWQDKSLLRRRNLLEDIKGPTRAHEVWVADFTYVRIHDKFAYFSTIMDLYTRKIVGMDISKTRNAEMILNSLRRALAENPGACPDIFHSDRGIEYANHMVGDTLKELGVKQSMSGKGNCYDNAHMESFFHTYKSELYYPEPFLSYEDFRRRTRNYVRFYNERRLHSSIGYTTPSGFERRSINSVNF